PPKPRKLDFELLRPFIYEVHWKIVPPPGFAPRPLPADESLTLGPAKLSRHASVDRNGVVEVNMRFDSGKTRLSPAEMHTLRVELGKLRQRDMALVTFDQVGQAHLAAGRVRQAIAEFKRLAALHPNEALHHAQIARALLGGGMGEAARSEAQTATR